MYNNKDKSKIGIKTSNENYIEESEKLNSHGTYDSEQNFDYIARHQKILVQM